jgi:hypothetical protein
VMTVVIDYLSKPEIDLEYLCSTGIN